MEPHLEIPIHFIWESKLGQFIQFKYFFLLIYVFFSLKGSRWKNFEDRIKAGGHFKTILQITHNFTMYVVQSRFCLYVLFTYWQVMFFSLMLLMVSLFSLSYFLCLSFCQRFQIYQNLNLAVLRKA